MALVPFRTFALAGAAVLALAACARDAPPEPASPPPAAPAPLVTPPVLGRAELLTAIAQAASAASAGEAYPEAAGGLVGRRFSLRLPFGCAGPQAQTTAAGEAAAEGAETREQAGWVYDPKRETLKLTVRPEAWTDQPWARTLVGTDETEWIEGFWIRRPWLLSEGCPAGAPAAAGVDSEQTVGLARVFSADSSRLTRRGQRAYEATAKLPPEPAPGAGGFRLLLEGRIAAPGSQGGAQGGAQAGAQGGPGPVRCLAAHADQRPTCLVRVEIDRVAFEDATGRRISEWTN